MKSLTKDAFYIIMVAPLTVIYTNIPFKKKGVSRIGELQKRGAKWCKGVQADAESLDSIEFSGLHQFAGRHQEKLRCNCTQRRTTYGNRDSKASRSSISATGRL
jgi:hypothetical protein